MSNFDYIVLFSLFIGNLFVGLFFVGKIKTFDYFASGGRSFGAFAIFATLSASFMGGGYTLGNAEKVFNHGMIYAFALLGFSLKEILVGYFIAPKIEKYKSCISIGEIIGKSYGKNSRIFTGIFSVLICLGILAAQIGAMGYLIQTLFDIEIYYGAIISLIFILLYCILGGMKSVVYTDIFQFLLLFIAMPIIFFIGMDHVGGWNNIVNSVPKSLTNPFIIENFWIIFIPLFLTFMFGEAFVPPYVQRLLMSKDLSKTKNATIWSGIISIPFFLMIGALGLIALVIDPSINGNQSIPFLAKFLLSDGFKGLVFSGLIAIVVSSASSFLNSASISFVNDVVKPIYDKNEIKDSKLLIIARIGTAIIGIGSVLFSLLFSNVMDILVNAYNFWSPLILIPFVSVVLGKAGTKQQFWTSCIFSLICMITIEIFPIEQYNIPTVVIGVIASLIGYIITPLILSSNKIK